MMAVADPRPCCSLVCVVPQVAFANVSLAPQPVPMMMMAPVGMQEMSFKTEVASDSLAEPSTWSWPEMSLNVGDAEPGNVESGNLAETSGYHQLPLYQPVDATAWSIGQLAAMGLPMNCTDQSNWESVQQPWVDLQQGVAAPEQFQMDFSGALEKRLHEPNARPKASSKSTLRRRHGHEADEKQSSVACNDDDVEPHYMDQVVTVEDTDTRFGQIVDQLLEQLQFGDNEKKAAAEHFQQLAFSSEGCRAAQAALGKASASGAAILLSGLRGKIRDAVQSKHANYVVQKALEVLPVCLASFVVEELVGVGAEIAKHRFACRILCRIFEHGSLFEEATSRLVDELLDKAKELSNHLFGNYVIRHLLEHGLPEHRHKIVSALSPDLISHAKDKNGSHVVEAALRFSTESEQHFIVQQLVANKDQLLSMTASQFGRHVVKCLLSLQSDLRQQVAETLRPLAPQLQGTRYGKSVLREVRCALSEAE